MKHDPAFADYAARLRALITESRPDEALAASERGEAPFNGLARELFELHYRHNAAYQKLCNARGVSPASLANWRAIPCVPTAAFKDFELTCWTAAERVSVFHSSGTSGQTPSRHFHNPTSLALYEASVLPWFATHLLPAVAHEGNAGVSTLARKTCFLSLTPPTALAPHSSLVHMFATVFREFGSPDSAFAGEVCADGSWSLDAPEAVEQLRGAIAERKPLVVLGTAFSFVHLLDFMAERNLRLRLPVNSRVLETGGYKGRSRMLAKPELHALITERLGVPATHIVSEYGMSELSSQAYDHVAGTNASQRIFHFPRWARARTSRRATRSRSPSSSARSTWSSAATCCRRCRARSG